MKLKSQVARVGEVIFKLDARAESGSDENCYLNQL